jgi:hypothetical protein
MRHWYNGTQHGRSNRFFSKIRKRLGGTRAIGLTTLEKIVGKNREITEPPPPTRMAHRARKFQA